MIIDKDRIAGVLLAGGQSRRMGGGDKCLRNLAGQPLLTHIIDRVGPQVGDLVLNANGDPTRFGKFGLPVIDDVVGGFAGPLAGVLTGLEWARNQTPAIDWIVTIPTDAPFLPRDLVVGLVHVVEKEEAEMACAASGGRRHPVVGLWPVHLAGELRRALVDEDIRKIDVWTAGFHLAVADFSIEPLDPFFNANRPEDFAQAAELLERSGPI
jgi:molybdopterin-guanine dinucleotide biosynthesis protein A